MNIKIQLEMTPQKVYQFFMCCYQNYFYTQKNSHIFQFILFSRILTFSLVPDETEGKKFSSLFFYPMQ